MSNKIRKTEEEWRTQLTDEQYQVTRQRGTEPPFTGEYEDYEGAGVYRCVCCGSELFHSGGQVSFGVRLALIHHASSW